jgi:fatty-acyl-CoA synthase
MNERSRDGGNPTLAAWLRALNATAPLRHDPTIIFPTLIDELADRFDAAPALIGEDQSLSYRALAQSANRYARWALAQRLVAGDVVCLLMPNCPEYMAIWLGLTRIGLVVSLINTNLAGEALRHSVDIVAPRHIIVAAEFAEAIAAVLPSLAARARCWVYGGGARDFPCIDEGARFLSAERLHRLESKPPAASDRALYIYTSGTTGLPKAASVSHFRLMQWSYWFAGMMDTCPNDRLYNCLPMYHSIGGVAATGAALVNGAAVVIRRRFSATRFWEEVVEENCTLFQYIGELCRYLVHSPTHSRETAHRLRLCCGNGLRSDVWEAFKSRFRIPRILEFYAATEGNLSIYNCEEEPGSIGRIPAFLAHRFPMALIKIDLATGEPIRGEAGFCLRCEVDEVGEAIGKIVGDGSSPGNHFEGYTDKDASERKVLRNAFATGDAWYRTGDLMRRDARGYFYFVDRIGDTFRWKGENVSTTEVGQAMTACPGVVEALVYGVPVPCNEGRAGMAALVVASSFSLTALRRHLVERLPDYARPRFLRMRAALAVTATFKPIKQELVRDGYDPSAIADPLYVDDREREAFVVLDPELHRRLQRGDLRL